MPSDFGDFVLALKFLAASTLLFVLPMAVGGLGPAAASMAVVVLCLAVAALITVSSGESGAAQQQIGRWTRRLVRALCRLADPDAAGHVQPRAPGLLTGRI